MKTLTIYDVYVEMQDQAQCDRMLQLCKDYNLPYLKGICAFKFFYTYNNYFIFSTVEYYIASTLLGVVDKTEVTEEQFIQMLKGKSLERNGFSFEVGV